MKYYNYIELGQLMWSSFPSIYSQIGYGNWDHYCWQRLEYMKTPRQACNIDTNNPGSNLVGETSTTMEVASIVFRQSNLDYSNELLSHAK